jgi:hypothetical protein
MNRTSRRRVEKIEEALSAAQKERKEKRKKEQEARIFHARLHLTAVAAIVLSGEPKLDEPLVEAWKRALQHCGISTSSFPGTRLDRQNSAAQQLVPLIMEGSAEEPKFAEIFRTAPDWLLAFTTTLMDALCLGFGHPLRVRFVLPLASKSLKWGFDGYEESRWWPLLPLGKMTDGAPLSNEEARHWLFPFPSKPVPEPKNNPAENEDSLSSTEGRDFFEALNLIIDVEENRIKEKELSRYQIRRLQRGREFLAALQGRHGDD